MKTINTFFAVLLVAVMSSNSFAQMHDHSSMGTAKTETIKVSGNCDMCKTRIEKAAKVEGVTKADWNSETKNLTLVYNSSKVTSEAVQKKIASVGHDAGKIKADDKVYAKLPGCCQYKRLK